MDQVGSCKRELIKFIKGDAQDTTVIVDVLTALEKMDVTYQTLKQTKIGQTVSKLRKSEDEDIATKSKFLIRKWKSIAATSPRESSGGTPTAAAPVRTAATAKPKCTTARVFIPKPVGLSPMREKVREKLVEILRLEEGDHESAATEVEEAMAKKFKLSTHYENKKEYTNKFRQLQFNLKKNTQLVQAILDGTVTGSDLVDMSSEQLATDEKRKEVEKLRDDAFQRTRLDWAEANADKINKQCGIDGNETGLFTCGRCKSTNTSNTQKQTRSADEPMTVFVLCHNCGNRWKC